MFSICSFESRRAEEMKSLIERQGGQATVVKSMQEVPLTDNKDVLEFADNLINEQYQIVLFMTGVGATQLLNIVETTFSRDIFLQALEKCTVIVRGPKPAAVLKKWGIQVDFKAPSPNTWKEILQMIDEGIPIQNKNMAIQEYGISNPEFYAELKKKDAIVHPVTVYRWAFPDDPEPLYQSVRNTIDGIFDALLFTSANQLTHVLQAAETLKLKEEWIQAAKKMLIASIGPTASEKIRSEGLQVDLEASPPKMGTLVRMTLEQGPDIILNK